MSRNSGTDSDYAFSAGTIADYSGFDSTDFGEDYTPVGDYRPVGDYSADYRAGVGGQAVDYRTDYSVEYLDTQGTFDTFGGSNEGTFDQQGPLHHSRHETFDQSFFDEDSFGPSEDYY